VLAIVDTSATETKKIVAQDLINGVLNVASAVGIGTASPGAKLEVSGEVRVYPSSSPAQIRFGVSGVEKGKLAVDTSSNMLFETAGTTRVTIDSSGNLGLGVTPSAWETANSVRALQLNGGNVSSFSNAYIWVGQNWYRDSASAERYINTAAATKYQQAFGAHSWFNAPSGTAGNAISFTQAMTLDASGNLALGGTSNKVTGLSGSGSGFTVQASAAPTIGVWDTSDTSYYLNLSQISENSYLWNIGNGILSFGTNNTERGRFTSGGYFKASNAGTYANSTAAYHELRTSAADYTAITSNSNASPYGAYFWFSAADPNNTTNLFLLCNGWNGSTNVTRATIRSNGGLANYQSNNVDLSDARTKKDIAPAASMWDKIGALEIVTYKYNDQTHDDVNVGVIAQQVESVEPVWVDADGFGETPEGEEPLKTVYTKDITFAAIKALQEAMARIEQLEADMAALKASA